ncbi:ABC transporter ATP-binding protein [uncultured Clostridium sp.]|uniref:ABC transporter ATP-binding protein n=1 Tax=uncultured Clostridium sp. TaxID=59620 RepID=UPI0025FE8325|nr:ABC transporter ATP-binding protein [uncultured Clostridium sp.]
MSDAILEVKNLCKHYKTKRGTLHAVDNISFDIKRGSTLGVVGESGCGKSTVGRTVLRLIEPTSGQIMFDGCDITGLNGAQMRVHRQKMQMIFQDPFASLDPRKTVNQIIGEPITLNKLAGDKEDCEKQILKLMDTVGLAKRWYNTYPHQLDGGRRQRIGIARALAVHPKLIVCDEPVSALDVSIQAQILNLLKELQEDRGLTCMFITHDLSVVHHFSDEIAVMYLGRIVEKAPSEELFDNPIHPYTRALLSAIPVPELTRRSGRIILKGEVASPIGLLGDCRFKKRCYEACGACEGPEPELKEISPGHYVACHCCTKGGAKGADTE